MSTHLTDPLTPDALTTAVLLRGTQLLDPLTGLMLVELGADGVWRDADGAVVNALQVASPEPARPAVAEVRPPRARRA